MRVLLTEGEIFDSEKIHKVLTAFEWREIAHLRAHCRKENERWQRMLPSKSQLIDVFARVGTKMEENLNSAERIVHKKIDAVESTVQPFVPCECGSVSSHNSPEPVGK